MRAAWKPGHCRQRDLAACAWGHGGPVAGRGLQEAPGKSRMGSVCREVTGWGSAASCHVGAQPCTPPHMPGSPAAPSGRAPARVAPCSVCSPRGSARTRQKCCYTGVAGSADSQEKSSVKEPCPCWHGDCLAAGQRHCHPAWGAAPGSTGGRGRARLCCPLPIKELTGGCDAAHKDEVVPACQLLHLPWKEEIRRRN